MSELETRLAELRVEWPPEPDVAARVRTRLEVEPRPRRFRPAWAVALAILVLGGSVAAVPPARSAVLRWLGIEGVRIQRVPEAPTPAPPTSSPALDLGERTRLASGTLVPRALGRPAAVYTDVDHVTLLYRPRRGLPESAQTGAGALLSQFPGRTHPDLIRKLAGPGTTIERVRVDGEPGYWLGGDVHSLIYQDPSGDIRESPMRLAGPTLVWRHGELTLRLEADITKSRALEIARSVE